MDSLAECKDADTGIYGCIFKPPSPASQQIRMGTVLALGSWAGMSRYDMFIFFTEVVLNSEGG